MKIAFVHDYLNQMGGAENVLEQLCEIFPKATVYTSIVDMKKLKKSFQYMDIKPSFLQRFPLIKKHTKKYLPFFPLAFEQMKLSGYDVILSISTGFAKGVSFELGTLHINYCLTPMRFAWMFDQYNKKEKVPFYYLPILLPLLKKYKKWDLEKNKNIHNFITLSNAVKDRIRNWYNRDSDIIYPPVDTSRFTILPDSAADYFLIVSRLRGYKRIDLAIKACSKLNKTLKIVGDGDQYNALKKMAGPTVEFLGYKSDEEVIKLMQNCKAFIFPGIEDFGIAPLEAQACGKPVIAFKAGGALDTIIENQTGVFFNEPTVESLCGVLEKFDKLTFNPIVCRKNAEKFSNENFRNNIKQYITDAYQRYLITKKN